MYGISLCSVNDGGGVDPTALTKQNSGSKGALKGPGKMAIHPVLKEIVLLTGDERDGYWLMHTKDGDVYCSQVSLFAAVLS